MEINLTSDPASAQDARERARRDIFDENSWHEPDAVSQSTFTTKKGRHFTATISGWKQMLMRGTKNYKMNRHPFTLLQITVRDEIGNTTSETYVAYCHRFSS